MTYELDFSELQEAMTPKGYQALKCNSRYLISYGGSGSGKSHAIAQKILFRILTEQNHRILIVRKTATSLKKSVSQLLQDILNSWQIQSLFSINKTDLTITCKANGNQILFSGLDDVEKLKSVAGISSIWVEEASEITFDDFTQLDLRLRGNTSAYKQIILSFNPTSSTSWLKKRFFDEKMQDVTIIHSTYKDNQFLDDEYKTILNDLANQNKDFYKIYALGEFGSLKGLIYLSYNLIDSLPNDYEFRSYGLDFGFNHPMALVEVRTIGDDVYIQEKYYRSQSLVTDLISAIKEDGIPEDSFIYADSANPDKIQMIKNAGFRNCKSAIKNVLAGIDYVKSKRLHITKDSTNLLKEIESYSWMIDRNNEPLDKPMKFRDDGMDSLRYALFRGEKIKLSIGATTKRTKSNFDDYDQRQIDIFNRDKMSGY